LEVTLFGFLDDTEDGERILASGSRRKNVRADFRNSRAFDLALMRLTDGKGSVLENLAAITGLTPDSLKARVKRARYDYVDTPEDVPRLEPSDKRYLQSRWGANTDPAVREWLRGINTSNRLKPDCRGSKDDTTRVAKPHRCRMPS
jgi:hypothetical protein